MKNSLKYLKLWQKKRNELQINDDQQSDWLEMQSVLDEHMPVSSADGEEGPSRSKGFKLLSLLLISLSAAAITYVVTTKKEIKDHNHKTQSYKVKKHITLNIDSSSRDSVADSLTANGVALNKKDSLLLDEQPVTLKNGIVANTPSANKTDSALSTVVSGSNQSAQIKNDKLLPPKAPNNNQVTAGSSHKNQNQLMLAFTAGSRTTFTPGGIPPSGKPAITGKNSSSLRSHASSYKDETYRYNSNSNSNGNNLTFDVNEAQNKRTNLLISAPKTIFGSGGNNFNARGSSALNVKTIQDPLVNKPSNNNKPGGNEKNAKIKNSSSANLNVDWGILSGANSSGSFTAKSQNSNFYGSLPVDLFFGVYATYNIGDKWGINSQIRLFSPQTIATLYTHTHYSKIDSTQSSKATSSSQSLQITSSRKIYSINIPLHAVYRVNNNLSFMAGPIINIPVKQVNATTTVQPATIKSDSVYYPKLLDTLNRTKYEQKLNLGLSGGVNIQIKRFNIGVTYMKSLSGYKVTSDFGTYKSYNGTFQFTIGFQLNRLKP
ncbi:MAG TPA: outer membrane beta-barrel protein [Mucilaginibacter sp.]|jgi:hypothetical protein